MRDARVARRPARRVVELTVWDVLSLSFDGGTAGHFKEGQRFQVSSHAHYVIGFIWTEQLRPPLDHESPTDAEKCLDGPPCGGFACVR